MLPMVRAREVEAQVWCHGRSQCGEGAPARERLRGSAREGKELLFRSGGGVRPRLTNDGGVGSKLKFVQCEHALRVVNDQLGRSGRSLKRGRKATLALESRRGCIDARAAREGDASVVGTAREPVAAGARVRRTRAARPRRFRRRRGDETSASVAVGEGGTAGVPSERRRQGKCGPRARAACAAGKPVAGGSGRDGRALAGALIVGGEPAKARERSGLWLRRREAGAQQLRPRPAAGGGCAVLPAPSATGDRTHTCCLPAILRTLVGNLRHACCVWRKGSHRT